ncbi:hypothetical protein P43SY_004414 [Pythium insidiosum]|uniref:UDP-glucosyl transferase family protein n=1 Tax=Pythium insidiosum TaxID=114742 RepID=A0AAD5M8D5_PYTIN|nr:hypothetical protein P43SY_004414 [Pythium insidiosum]
MVRPSLRSCLVTLLSLVPLVSAIDVAIVATFGTRSDVAPLFEGLIDFARQPGNTITYIAARGIAERHASQFSYIKTEIIDELREPAYLSPNHSAISDVVQTRRRIDNTQLFLDGIGHIVDVYEDNAAAFLKYFRKHRYDLVLCDAVEQACMDVVKETGHKLAIYGPLGQYGVGADWYIPDFLAPVPMEQLIASPWLRAKGYLDLIPFIVATLQARWKIQAAQERLGFTAPFTEPWEYPQKHLMLAHHVLGVDPARNIPSNIHVFGPVVNEENIPPIEPETKAALDALHADGVRVVAIALGSVFTLKDSPELYDAMMTSIEQLISDKTRRLAVLWPCKWHDPERVRRLETLYPGRLLTPKWITMRRALMHDAVQLFFNQAGYASMAEAMVNGKGQVMMPIYFDQFLNTVNAESIGLSLSLDKYTLTAEEMTSKVVTLLDEMAQPNSTYSATLAKWKAICRLNSDAAKASVTSIITMAATVGTEHLVPRDVDLSVFDRFPVWQLLAIGAVAWWLRKQLSRMSTTAFTKTKTT